MLTCATWSGQKRKAEEEERRLAFAPLLRPSPAAPASAPKREQSARAAAGAPRAATPPSAAQRRPDLGRPGPRRRGALPGFPAGWAQGAAPFRATAEGAGEGPGRGELPRCGRPARGRRRLRRRRRRRAQVKGRARGGGRRPLGAEPAAAESPEPPHGALVSRRPGADGLCGFACECASECKCVCARALACVGCGWACALASWRAGGEAPLVSPTNQLTEPREGSCRSRPGRRPFRPPARSVRPGARALCSVCGPDPPK